MHTHAAARAWQVTGGELKTLTIKPLIIRTQTIGRPTIGPHSRWGAGVQRACMYRYQGPVRVFLAGGLLHMLMFIFRVRSSDDLGGRRQNHTIFIWCDCPKHDRYSGPPDQNGTLQG